MSGPHQAPTVNALHQQLTRDAERLNGSANLNSVDRSLVRTLTEVYKAAVEQNHQDGYPAASLKNEFRIAADNIMASMNDPRVASTMTLSPQDGERLLTRVGQALDQALSP